MERVVNFKRKISACFRVSEPDFVRTEAERFPRRLHILFKIVLPVSHNRHPCMCQLRADLMMSAGSQMNPKNGAPVFLLQNLVGKLRPLCSRCTAFHNRRRIGSAVTQKIICKLPVQCSLFFLLYILHKVQVRHLDF